MLTRTDIGKGWYVVAIGDNSHANYCLCLFCLGESMLCTKTLFHLYYTSKYFKHIQMFLMSRLLISISKINNAI